MNKTHRRKTGTKAGLISKREMMEVVEGLAARGLGARSIARLIGYHESTVKRRLVDMGAPRMTNVMRVRRIIECLPEDLRDRAGALRLRVEAMDAGEPLAAHNGAAEARMGGV